MFAVVAISGKQYKVSPKQMVVVDRLPGNVGDSVTLDQVLLTDEDGKTTVGTPTIAKIAVKAKILAQSKGAKIDVFRYKSKVRYRKHRGFRPTETKLEILSIG